MKNLLTILACVILGILILPAILQHPAKDNAREEAVKADTMRLLEAFTDYYEEFGAYPDGDAAAMIRALSGENPARREFFQYPPDSINTKGELLDPWGTPYRITPSPGAEPPEIHSAGKNHLFETATAMHADDFRSRRIPR